MKDWIMLFLVFFPMAAAIVSYLIGKVSKETRNYFADGAVIVRVKDMYRNIKV